MQNKGNSGCRSRIGCFLRALLYIAIGFGIGAFAVSHGLNCQNVSAGDSYIFYSTPSDGDFFVADATYSIVRDASEAEYLYDELTSIDVGQNSQYCIWRSCLFFDTSSIPDDAIITSASLHLHGYVNSDMSNTDFLVVIQNGQPVYPHDPMEVGDYDRTNYSGDGGSLTTVGWNEVGYNVIELNTDGIDWISKNGTTKFILRSSRDINGDVPTGMERIGAYANEQSGIDKDPYLSVTWKYDYEDYTFENQSFIWYEAASNILKNNNEVSTSGWTDLDVGTYYDGVGVARVAFLQLRIHIDSWSNGIIWFAVRPKGITGSAMYPQLLAIKDEANFNYVTLNTLVALDDDGLIEYDYTFSGTAQADFDIWLLGLIVESEINYATLESITSWLEASNYITAENITALLEAGNYTTPDDVEGLIEAGNYTTPDDVEGLIEAGNYTTSDDVDSQISAWANLNNVVMGGIGMPLWYLLGLAALAAGAWWSRSMLVNIMVAAMAGAGFPLVESTLEVGSATYWGVYLVLFLAVVYALIQIFTRVGHW